MQVSHRYQVSNRKQPITTICVLMIDYPPVQKGYPKFTTFPVPGKTSNFSFILVHVSDRRIREWRKDISPAWKTRRANLDTYALRKIAFWFIYW